MEAAALAHFVLGLDKATKVIIVSNRQPWFHERVAERIRAFRPASGARDGPRADYREVNSRLPGGPA